MIPVQDIPGTAGEIRDLIASNQVSVATKRLIDLATEWGGRQRRNEAILISRSLHKLDDDENLGLLDRERAEADRNRTLLRALALVDAIEERPWPDGIAA